VIDVRGQLGVRVGIVEGRSEKNLVDGIRGRLDAARPRQVLAERFANEVTEGHALGTGHLGGPPMEVGRQQELSPMHV
jgi:hypothetical protein